MNKSEYNTEEADIKVVRMWKQSGEFVGENGPIKYANAHVMISVNGQKITAKVDKAFIDVIDEELGTPSVF